MSRKNKYTIKTCVCLDYIFIRCFTLTEKEDNALNQEKRGSFTGKLRFVLSAAGIPFHDQICMPGLHPADSDQFPDMTYQNS